VANEGGSCMTTCNEISARMSLYLDDELEANECADIEVHLAGCGRCRGNFDGERRFLETVRGVRPLHEASQKLRARVEPLVNHLPPAPLAPPELRRSIHRSLWQFSGERGGFFSPRNLVGSAAIAAVILAGMLLLVRHDKEAGFRPSDFAAMAADTHQRHIHGQLPLEIVSDLPEHISKWFAGKLPFRLKLPNYQASSGQDQLYELEGARLVGYKSDYAAYVAYQMRARPISLVVTSDAVARPTNGEQIVAKGITFHYNSINGLKVLTWSDGGLTYALVSDLEERGQQSCVVCHQSTKDQDFIESLKPR